MNFILDPSLVLYLPLYELDGSSFASKDAYGSLCTVTGAIWRPDGWFFDGIDDVIDCGIHAQHDLIGGISLVAWVKVAVDEEGDLISKKSSAGVQPKLYQLRILTDGTVRLYLRHQEGSNDTSPSVASTRVVDDGNWHMLGAAYDAASGAGEIRIDDTRDGSAALDAGNITFDDKLYVGGTGDHLSGNMGLALIYNRFLSPIEYKNIYLATKWRYR